MTIESQVRQALSMPQAATGHWQRLQPLLSTETDLFQSTGLEIDDDPLDLEAE